MGRLSRLHGGWVVESPVVRPVLRPSPATLETPGGDPRPINGWADNPRWYQEAVFYEIFVSGFYDANNDGIGDLKGLIAKLDYVQWLGVDCLWLLPFYQSPYGTAGTTSPTSAPSCLPTVISTTPAASSRRPIGGASASSPTWS